MRLTYRILVGVFVFLLICIVAVFMLSRKAVPADIIYGLSFNTLYAEELGLDWKEVYKAILDDLQVKHLRLAAHWNLVEPRRGTYNWSEMDHQLSEARAHGVDVIFGVGRRLPRWPECHTPEWAQTLSWEEQKKEIRSYITAVVTRYKDDPTIIYWQVENEPYLGMFAKAQCGAFDEAFLKEEIALVRSLDSTRPILLTDSGNLGTWIAPYRYGDAFGTSVYVYFWNPEFGQFKTVLPPWFYRAKEGLLRVLFGEKQTFLIELSVEPWLLEPIVDTPVDVQYSRMDIGKFNEIIEYAKETRYEKQYLWGAEWWYYLKQKGHAEMWDKGKEIFAR